MQIVLRIALLRSTSTLTIRLPTEQREALKRSAKLLKKTESQYIRDLLARDLDTRTIGERIGPLAGILDSYRENYWWYADALGKGL